MHLMVTSWKGASAPPNPWNGDGTKVWHSNLTSLLLQVSSSTPFTSSFCSSGNGRAAVADLGDKDGNFHQSTGRSRQLVWQLQQLYTKQGIQCKRLSNMSATSAPNLPGVGKLEAGMIKGQGGLGLEREGSKWELRPFWRIAEADIGGSNTTDIFCCLSGLVH